MSVDKYAITRGLLGKAESTYGGGGSLSASTDGILTAVDPMATTQYLYNGDRPTDPGTAGQLSRGTPRGRHVELPVEVRMRGAGASYNFSGPVVPQDLDLLLRIGGRARTITDGVKAAYQLSSSPADFVSGVFGAYTASELLSIVGAYSTFGYTIDGMGEVAAQFGVRGAVSAVPSDAATPAITYQNIGTKPPISDGVLLVLGSYVAPKLRRLVYAQNRPVNGPHNRSQGGVGFHIGRFGPTVEIVLEATALVGSPYHTTSGLNATELYERVTQLGLSVEWGASGAWNRWKHSWTNAELMAPPDPSKDGDVALWTLRFAIPGAGDLLEALS